MSLRTIKTTGVACVALLIASYAGYIVYADWVSEAPHRAAAAQARKIQQHWNRLRAAANRLQQNGARFPNCKGICFRTIDLSQWHARPSEFDDLRILAELPELQPLVDSTLSIRLGPNIDASILPVLVDLTNLEVLDLNGAQLTTPQVEYLRERLPNCRLDEIEDVWDR